MALWPGFDQRLLFTYVINLTTEQPETLAERISLSFCKKNLILLLAKCKNGVCLSKVLCYTEGNTLFLTKSVLTQQSEAQFSCFSKHT